MANPAPPRSQESLIAGQYAVDVTRPFPAIGALPAFGVTDQHTGRTDLMAVQVQRRHSPRLRVLQALTNPIDGLMSPVGHGAVPVPGPEDAYYVVSLAPPGPSLLSRLRAWPEAELMASVLRPAAHVLEQLQLRGVTHRGIRLDNVFQSHRGEPIVLGSAWEAPPAMAQPALFEPPYSAMCLPAGRGDGSIADDVYALGVLLLCLALGHAPLAQLDEAAVLRRKLEQGSFTALAGDERLPPVIADLVRGMLAEDPEHRPPPALLLDPASARSRRVAARPPRRAQRAITLADMEVWDARSLARAMALQPEPALHALRGGLVVQWLRRSTGEPQLAARLEELVRHQALDGPVEDASSDSSLVMRAIGLLDPLAPLCWHGIAFWPDGIGSALAAAQDTDPEIVARLGEVITLEVAGSWAAIRPERCDFAMLRVEARQQHTWLQQRGPAAGVARLTYLLNPLLPCASPLLRGRWVVRLTELLPALESAAAQVDRKEVSPVDAQVAAFIAARTERRLDNEMTALAGGGSNEAARSAQLRLLAQVQAHYHPLPLPGLAGWLAEQAAPMLATWHNRERRSAMLERLQGLARNGYIPPMLALLEDAAARGADAREAKRAAADLNRIDAELSQIATSSGDRFAAAYRLGQEIAAGVGLAALATMLVVAALG